MIRDDNNDRRYRATYGCLCAFCSFCCRERKLPSSCVLITPGVASGQHFIFGQLRSLPSYRSTKKYFNRAFPSSRHAFRFLLTVFTEDSFLIVYSPTMLYPSNRSYKFHLFDRLLFDYSTFTIDSDISFRYILYHQPYLRKRRLW